MERVFKGLLIDQVVTFDHRLNRIGDGDQVADGFVGQAVGEISGHDLDQRQEELPLGRDVEAQDFFDVFLGVGDGPIAGDELCDEKRPEGRRCAVDGGEVVGFGADECLVFIARKPAIYVAGFVEHTACSLVDTERLPVLVGITRKLT